MDVFVVWSNFFVRIVTKISALFNLFYQPIQDINIYTSKINSSVINLKKKTDNKLNLL